MDAHFDENSEVTYTNDSETESTATMLTEASSICRSDKTLGYNVSTLESHVKWDVYSLSNGYR